MASIVPPLDFIPKLPGKAVDIIIKQIDTQTDKLLTQVNKVVQDSTKLPVNIKCDDPRVNQMKDQLAAIQKQLTQVQAQIPKCDWHNLFTEYDDSCFTQDSLKSLYSPSKTCVRGSSNARQLCSD